MAVSTTTQFHESEYNSEMRLAVTLDTLEIFGSYRTPPSAGFLGGYVQGFGESNLRGRIEKLPDGSGTVIAGTWCHTEGLLGDGTFEVRWDAETGSMRGWWAETNGPQNTWVWKKDVGLTAAVTHFVHSIWMSRYTLLVIWFVFLGTAVQSGIAIFPGSSLGRYGNIINLYLMALYGLLFGSFFPAYYFMYQRPTHAYMSGMFLFTIGYVIFAVYFGLMLIGAAFASNVLYVMGSVLFLIASLHLTLATWPKGSQPYSVFKKEAAIFWGCVLFLIGSVAFSADSIRVMLGAEYTQMLGIVGNVLFDVGLWYFLWSCTTPDVGFFVLPPRKVRSQLAESPAISREISLLSAAKSSAASVP